MRKLFFAIIFCSTAFVAAAQSNSVSRDVSYCTNAGVVLKLDLYFPAKTNEPAPTAVYIHGGGWEHGSKSGGGWFDPVKEELLARGYVVAAVDYRLAPEHKWPAFIHDVKASIRFLRANASKYHIDPQRIGTWGSSAGGHLVSLLGTTDASAKLEGDHYLDQSSRVQAVVDLFGPSKLNVMKATEANSDRASRVFGADKATIDHVLTEASPMTYVSKGDAPFLIIHGEDDTLVPVEQGKILHEQLRAAGVPSRLVVVKNGTHGLGKRDIEPSRMELVKMIADFFDEQLHHRSTK